MTGDSLHLSRRLAGIALLAGGDRKRQPSRPIELRQAGFDQQFDWTTLVYDGVLVPEDRTAILTCPPALNLQKDWEAARFIDFESGECLRFELVELDRLLRILVRGVSETTRLRVYFGDQDFDLDISDGDAKAFRDKKVLMTVSKDNEISWIVDWAYYHAQVHGIDCVLLMDNNSRNYSRETLVKRLAEVPGISLVHVVEWPFLWGPTAGTSGIWDSNFGQHGAFEVCRWRFLRDAALVVNADVDELVIPRGNLGLFDFCEQSKFGAALYGGRWVVGLDSETRPGLERRHRDYAHMLPRKSPLDMAKWAIQPRRATDIKQWTTHRLRGAAADVYTDDFETGHFRQISTGWKYAREKRGARLLGDVTRDNGIMELFQQIGWKDRRDLSNHVSSPARQLPV